MESIPKYSDIRAYCRLSVNNTEVEKERLFPRKSILICATKFYKNLEKLREQDNRGLLISATGTGKHLRQPMKSIDAKKSCLLCTEQIARQALETFKPIFINSRSYGLLTGQNKNTEADFIFATIQTISKQEVYQSFF